MQTKRLKAWLYPVAIEREYTALMTEYAKELQSATYKALNMRQDASEDDYKTLLSVNITTWAEITNRINA